MISEEEVIEVVGLHSQDIRGFFLRRGVGLADCDDLLQEVFTVLWRRREEVDSNRTRLYLFGIARTTASAYWRKQMRNTELHDALSRVQENHLPKNEQVHESSVFSPELEKHLEFLTPRQKEVLGLVFGKNMSISEVARHMGVARGTVLNHHSRALESLSGVIKGKNDIF